MADSFTYGSHTADALSVMKTRIQSKFDSVNLTFNLYFAKGTPSSLLTAITDLKTALRVENQKVHLVVNGSDFFEKDPANNEILVVRAEVTEERIGASDADVTVSVIGRLPSRLSDGNYPIEWDASVSTAEKVTAKFKGAYTAISATGAQSKFENAGTGAKAKCLAILDSFFSGRSWIPIFYRISDPEDTDDWIQFEYHFVEQLVPNANPHYDFTQLVIRPILQPMGIRPFYGTPGRTIGEDRGRTQEGGGVPVEDYSLDQNLVKYSVSGNIPVYLSSNNYDDLMSLWESNIRPAIWDFVHDYFASQAEFSGDYSELFIEDSSAPFDITENGISPNLTFVSPASGGILTFAESFGYEFDEAYHIEDYEDGEDKLNCWIGKRARSVFCDQSGRIEKIKDVPIMPLPPPLPDGETGFWVPVTPYKHKYNARQFQIVDRKNRTFWASSISFSIRWKLVAEGSE